MDYNGFNSYPSSVRCGICDKRYVNVTETDINSTDLQAQDHNHNYDHGHIGNDSAASGNINGKVSNMLCASCVSFKMLRFRLNMINIEDINSKASFEVSRILEGCMNGNASVLLKTYIHNKELESGRSNNLDGELAGTNDQNSSRRLDNTDNNDEQHTKMVDGVPIPSQDSVSRLAHLLLNVEVSNLHDRLKYVKSKINYEKEKKEELRRNILKINKKIEEKKLRLETAFKSMESDRNVALKKVTSSIEEIEIGKLGNIKKLIQNSRLKLARQNIDILSVRKLSFENEQHDNSLVKTNSIQNLRILNSKASDEYLNKLNKNLVQNYIRNKNYTITDFKIAIDFIPLLSFKKYINYSAHLINATLNGLSDLTGALAHSLGIELFFPIYKFITEDDVEYLNSKSENSRKSEFKNNFEPCMTVIGTSSKISNNLDQVVFPLNVAKKGILSDELSLVELESAQLLMFSNALARLIIDLLLIIQHIDSEGKRFPLDSVKLEQLLNVDQLVKVIVFDILLNDQIVSSTSDKSSEISNDSSLNVNKVSQKSDNDSTSKTVNRRVSFSEAVFNFWTRKRRDSNNSSENLTNYNKEAEINNSEKNFDPKYDSKVEKVPQFNFEYYQNLYRSERIDLASKLSMSSLNKASGLLGSLTMDNNNQSRSISPDIVNISNSNSSSQSTFKAKNKLNLSSLDSGISSSVEDPLSFTFDSSSIWNVDLVAKKLFDFFCYDISKAAENLDIFKMYTNVTISEDSTVVNNSSSQVTWNSQTLPNSERKNASEEIKYRSNNGSSGFTISPKTKNSMALSSANMMSFPYAAANLSTSNDASSTNVSNIPGNASQVNNSSHGHHRERSAHHQSHHSKYGNQLYKQRYLKSSSDRSLSSTPRNANINLDITSASSSSSPSASPISELRTSRRRGRLSSPPIKASKRVASDDNWEVI